MPLSPLPCVHVPTIHRTATIATTRERRGRSRRVHLRRTAAKPRGWDRGPLALDDEERITCISGSLCPHLSMLTDSTEVELRLFGKVRKMLSKLGNKEQTNKPLTIRSNLSFNCVLDTPLLLIKFNSVRSCGLHVHLPMTNTRNHMAFLSILGVGGLALARINVRKENNGSDI